MWNNSKDSWRELLNLSSKLCGFDRRPPRVIRALADRVEKEHAQHLRDAQRIEDRSALAAGSNSLTFGSDLPSDFARLVGAGAAHSPPTNGVNSTPNGNALEDDIWGSILNDEARSMLSTNTRYTD
jgi:hypothetical protein